MVSTILLRHYSMCCGLLRYVREVKPEINIFKDPQYADFQRTLDAEMNRLRSTGLGVKPKRAEPINMSEESTLWEAKIAPRFAVQPNRTSPAT